MHYDFKPSGVCARMVHIELDEDRNTIESISFDGGCDGNLSAISKLVKGMPVDEVIGLLEGNTCGSRPTSCADQMTRGLRAAREAEGDVVLAAPIGIREMSF